MKKQIQNFINQKVMIQSKNDEFEIIATLQFFNFDKNVIHLHDYLMFKERILVEKGDFIVFNHDEWKNLRIPEKNTIQRIEEETKMGKEYFDYEETIDKRGLRGIKLKRDSKGNPIPIQEIKKDGVKKKIPVKGSILEDEWNERNKKPKKEGE